MRTAKILGWIFAILIGLPAALLILVLLLGNTGVGQRMIARALPQLSGGTLAVQSLSGRFPDRLRAGQAELRDPDGTYATIEDLALDWSPLRLLRGEVAVARLAVARLALLRLPVPQQSQSSSGLAFQVDIDRLAVGELALPPALVGGPATVSLTGTAHLVSADEGSVTLEAQRSEDGARYRVEARMDKAGIAAHIRAEEQPGGLAGNFARLPDLGALSLTADLEGPRNAETVSLTARAGALTAQASGRIDLVGHTADLDVTAGSPEMTPAASLAWQRAALEAHLHGAFTAPELQGRFTLENLRATDAGARRVQLEITGSGGRASLTGTIDDLILPGPQPALLAAAPLTLSADIALDNPARPVDFTLSHPLIAVSGHAETAESIAAEITAKLADLTPFAAIAGVALQGRAELTADLRQRDGAQAIEAQGTIAITGGMPQAVQMIGEQGRFSLAARLAGGDITLERLGVEGRRARMSASGSGRAGAADLDWQLALSDVQPLAPSLSGSIDAHGTLHGAMDDLVLSAEADADLASAGFPRAPLHLAVDAQGLPGAPRGRLTAQGNFDRSPLDLALGLARGEDGGWRVAIDRLEWRSLRGSGAATLPPDLPLPIGNARLHVGTLADLAPFIGAGATGTLDAAIEMQERAGKPQAHIRVTGNALALSGMAARALSLEGTIDDPATRPVAALTMKADGLAAGGVTGGVELAASGPVQTLALRLTGRLDQAGKPLALSGTAQANLPRSEIQLSAFTATYAGETARLLAPAHLALGKEIRVDRLRLGLQRATIELAGKLSPALDMSASARNLDLALAKPFMPGLTAQGVLNGEARLTGSFANADGTVRLTGTGLRLDSGAGRAMPPANIQASARVKGGSARIDAKLTAGSRAQLTLSGQAPLDGTKPVALRGNGTIDLALLDPILAANGRHVQGRLQLDAGIAGTLAEPRISGTAALSNGELQDYMQGVHITDIAAEMQADGQVLRIRRFIGRAGPGSLSAAGAIDLLAPGMPVQITLEAQNARPLASDLITATLSGQMRVSGQATGQMRLAGNLAVARAEITIPDSFPPQVAKLPVRIPGKKPPPERAASQPLALDLTVDAPQQIFVRGHGLDAEMGGKLRVAGTSAAPQITGGFDMRHGTFSLAGETLTITSGKVTFEGSNLRGKLDPALNFVAQTNSAGVTATLTITGFADQPKIALTSAPDLPQDEILAHLLFGQSVKQLGPIQLAEIADALVSLGGGGGANPLAAVRKGLGLDRLSVGSSGTGPGGTVEAGKYVANGVFVGAKQGTSGGTQAEVQIDLTKHLKLQTTVGSGSTPATGATPQNDPGSSLGLKYEFEY